VSQLDPPSRLQAFRDMLRIYVGLLSNPFPRNRAVKIPSFQCAT
jgi:hypothetical protein